MNAHTRKTLEAIQSSPAPRDLDWQKFVTMWEDVAQEVEQESGDRLAVRMHGHREVFRRPHDGRVSIEDVERARHLLRATPDPKGSGRVIAVAIDDRGARIFDFDLDAETVDATEQHVRDADPRTRKLRTIERHSGHEDEQLLNKFFDDVADALRVDAADHSFVVLGHGHGKADAAAHFVARLKDKHVVVADHLAGVADVDLSAASEADLENAAVRVVRGGAS